MPDREQKPRDAEKVAAWKAWVRSGGGSEWVMERAVAHALLAELEQAKRERDEWKDKAFDALEVSRTANDNCERMEARLAKVPALVGALRKTRNPGTELPLSERRRIVDEVLAAYEQEQDV